VATRDSFSPCNSGSATNAGCNPNGMVQDCNAMRRHMIVGDCTKPFLGNKQKPPDWHGFLPGGAIIALFAKYAMAN
jgi:hypothetical protein